MGFSDEIINRVYDKNDGYCSHCGKKLSFCNYGREGRGSWEVDHSRPRSRGGTDHMNNLKPSCTDCNREKGDQTSQEYKRRNY